MTSRRPGFTLIELLVAMIVSSILISITISTYSLFRKSMNLDQGRSTIAQNNRIALDRLSRELRQTPEIVTEYPADADDTSVAQPGQIEFEDGHANDLTYKRYYITGSTLKVDVKQYYFSYDPTYRVTWNAVGNGNVAPIANTISTQDIADN